MPQPSRRRLLQSTLAAAAFAVPAVHAAGADTLRVGMIGCGGRCAGAAIDALSADPGTRLVAMCDLFADRVEAKYQSIAAQKPQQVSVDKDHRLIGLDAYKQVIDSSDVVLIANAAKFHPLHLRAAVEAGKHVFVEKPHAIDPVGVRQVAAACELAKKKNIGVLSGLHCRFDPAIVETIQRIQDGAIGQIVAIEENFLRAPYGTLYRAPRLTEIQYQYSNQYRFAWLSGDDVTQSLIHNLDRAVWCMGDTPPSKCHGLGGRSSSEGPYIFGDVFDHHSVVYQYDNGVRLYAFCRTQNNTYAENSSIVMGTKGAANTLTGRITGENPWKYSGPRESPYRREHAEFFKSIRAAAPLNCGDYMTRGTLTAVMGQLSCYSGKEITWKQTAESAFAFPPRPEDCTWEMQPPVKPDDNGVYPVAVPGASKAVYSTTRPIF